MLVTERVRRVRKHLGRHGRRYFAEAKRMAHRHERRVARQLLGSGADDLPCMVTLPVTERDVI
jgi:hypothetical protein